MNRPIYQPINELREEITRGGFFPYRGVNIEQRSDGWWITGTPEGDIGPYSSQSEAERLGQYVLGQGRGKGSDEDFIRREYQQLRSSGFRHEDAIRYLDREFGVSREQVEAALSGSGRGGKDDPVGDKIKKLMDEGKSQDQAVAIATSMEDKGTLGRGGPSSAERLRQRLGTDK